jgi:hypothetical protein
MSAGSLFRPRPAAEKGSGLASGRAPVHWFHSTRERSLTEMMSLSDWRWFVPETLGLLIAISLARSLLFSGSAGPGNMPHPFWMPVLLMSGQYGIMGGLFAALAATAAFFISGLPAQSAAQDFYAYASIVAAQPCAWFGTALVLGGLRTLHIHHQTELQERLDQTGLAAEELADGLEGAAGEIERLELRIASDGSTLTSFLHSLAKIELSDRRSLMAGIADVVRYGVGATDFVLYLNGAHGLEPCLGVEDGARLNLDAIAQPTPSLLQEIRKGVAGADPPASSDRVARTPPYWAPIRLAGVAEPIGIVVCHRVQASQDPATAVRRLQDMCRVLAVLLYVFLRAHRDGGR